MISIALINLILFAKRYVRLEIPAFIVICVASMAVIFLWAPIGNPNKTLDMMEKKVYKRKSHIITVMGFLSIITAFIFKWQILYEGIIYGMFLSAALLIAGKIKYRTLLAMEKC